MLFRHALQGYSSQKRASWPPIRESLDHKRRLRRPIKGRAMMDYQAYGHSAAANGRRGLSRLRFVLIGALAPLALFALPVGTMMLVGPTGESAPAAGSGPALDCGSSRNAWRPACQAAKTNLVRDADVTGSINERAATAGAAGRRVGHVGVTERRDVGTADRSPAAIRPRGR